MHNESLELFISPEYAARQLDISLEQVFELVDQRKLFAGVLVDGSIIISQKAVYALLPKESLPEYIETDELRGNRISINEAARKYQLNSSTVTRWMQRGYIQKLGKDGNKTILDEADVAYCARIAKQKKGRGKWVFNKDGKPYYS